LFASENLTTAYDTAYTNLKQPTAYGLQQGSEALSEAVKRTVVKRTAVSEHSVSVMP
jgi:hypothetical protein